MEQTAPNRSICEGSSLHYLRIYGDIRGRPLEIGFDSLAIQLQRLPNLFFEMDGSFVWVGRPTTSDSRGWQLDGMVYDLGERVQYIELKGTCERSSWLRLLAILSCGSDERFDGLVKFDDAKFEEGVKHDDLRPLGIHDLSTGEWTTSAEFEIGNG